MKPIDSVSSFIKDRIKPSPSDDSDSKEKSGIVERLTNFRSQTDIEIENSPKKFQYSGVGSSPAAGAAPTKEPKEYEYVGAPYRTIFFA